EALDVVGQRRDEARAAHFAVAYDVDAASLLKRDRFVHGAVLDPLELGDRDAVGGEVGARLLEPSRPQYRADHLGTINRRHRLANRVAAVDDDGRAGDEVGSPRSEKHRRTRTFFGRAEAAGRRALDDVVVKRTSFDRR